MAKTNWKGFDWKLGKAFFIISRVPGVVAHAYEEMTRERPVRKLGPMPYEYDCPGIGQSTEEANE